MIALVTPTRGARIGHVQAGPSAADPRWRTDLTAAVRYSFGSYELDPPNRRLVGPDGDVHVEPQVFDVLVHLVSNRTRVVTKQELLDEVWGTRFVSESALTSRIRAARSAIGDSGRQQDVIRTVHGTGYQFVAEVAESITPIGSTSGPDDGAACTLPVSGNPFRGRERELAELGRLLATERLVTVIGPGGTGKTRLSTELARELMAERPVAFVDLAAVRDEHALGQALATALAIGSGVEVDVLAACTAFLRARPTVLIVDNCEHVVAAVAELVARVLAEVEHATVLATSRVPIGLADELLYRLQPLPVLVHTDELSVEAAADNPAIAVFCDRARKVKHDFEMAADSLPDVAALCSALDGLPLALELAAGRMGVFSVGDLLARLDRRLDLLGDERSSTDARHRTLRATLDWSHDLLDPSCRGLFRFLSVFPAGLTLEGVEWLGERINLAADPVLALNGLVESSLVGRTEALSGTRYVQLETMRTFGHDLLAANGEKHLALDLAAAWALEVTGEMRATLLTPREQHCNDLIRREIPNIREARLHLRASGRTGDLVQISANLEEWARLRDCSEVWTWCDELDDVTADRGLRGRIAAVRALAAWRRGRIEDAEKHARTAIDLAEDDWTLARGWSALGVAELFRGRFADAAAAWDARVAIDGHQIDAANSALCRAYAGGGVEVRREIDDIRARIGDDWPSGESWAAYVTGEIGSLQGADDSIGWLETAIERAWAVGASFTVGVAGVTLCTAMVARGDIEGAARRYRDLIEHWLRSGTWTQQWTTLRNAAALLEESDPRLALAIIDAAAVDPYAPEMEASVAAEFDSLRDRLVRSVDADRALHPPAERSELAERTRAALAGDRPLRRPNGGCDQAGHSGVEHGLGPRHRSRGRERWQVLDPFRHLGVEPPGERG